MWRSLLQWTAVITGVLGAVFWYLSSATKIPEARVPSAKRRTDGTFETFPNPQDAAFKRQGIYNRVAAGFAIVAAVSALILIFG
jgi:hypothetical protein